MQETISAIISTYKREISIVKRALDSVVNQTYKIFEIILVNDNPEDKETDLEIRKLISSEEYKCHNIKYIVVEKNGGACKARNIGLKNAKGKYVAFLDDDDEWLPRKNEVQISAFLNNSNIRMVYCNVEYFYEEINKTEVLYSENQPTGRIFDETLAKNRIGSCSFPMFRTDALKEIGGFDEKMPAFQDWELYLRFTKKYEVGYVPEICVRYHEYVGERISKNHSKRVEAFEMIRASYKQDIRNNKKSAASFWLEGGCFYRNNKNLLCMTCCFLRGFFCNPRIFVNLFAVRFKKMRANRVIK